LMVELCNLGPLPGDEWGFTGTFDRENGGGFLTDHFPAATKVIDSLSRTTSSGMHVCQFGCGKGCVLHVTAI
jgi:formamidase